MGRGNETRGWLEVRKAVTVWDAASSSAEVVYIENVSCRTCIGFAGCPKLRKQRG